ncbi:alpha-1,2-fucosyltransferase [Lactococcus nasutitermitis]|uniref:Alpha-1,2-fucosyltransferase n=1 Tax=Lactococcus nasutitermitis TaxID=1652957 RepID=A0ABV9JBJ5_9LACT|nr:alpha-1,2-fucosyltransferase [Lactococcus nasutitermitis]
MKHSDKKIVVEVHGRLGNQLFQYAFARSIQAQVGGEILMNFQALEMQAQRQPDEKGWEDSLQGFQTIYERKDAVELTVLQRLIVALGKLLKTRAGFRTLRGKPYDELTGWAKAFADLSRKHSVYHFPNLGLPFVAGKEKTIFLKGFFEDEQFANPVREQLLEEFQPREALREQNKELMRVIEEENSVCVTIRRGDFVGKKQLFMCDEDYFKRGMAIIREKVENPVFVFFSDDLAYAQEFAESALGENERYFIETPDNSLPEKLRLMAACKHFIISNSTFSWWAQYLGQAEDKIVVGPKRWMPAKPVGQTPVMESWIKL